MIGRMYTVVIGGVASPAAAIFDLWEVTPVAAKPIRIRRVRLAQTSEPTSEEEQLGISIVRGHTTSGSGGSQAVTPTILLATDTAAAFTADTMNTTIASGGTTNTPFQDAWNTRAGYDMAFAPEEAIMAVNATRLVVRSAAPADAITIRGTLWVEEMA